MGMGGTGGALPIVLQIRWNRRNTVSQVMGGLVCAQQNAQRTGLIRSSTVNLVMAGARTVRLHVWTLDAWRFIVFRVMEAIFVVSAPAR